MYHLTASHSVEPDNWDQALHRLNGCPFHSYKWSRYSGENRDRPIIYFTLTDSKGTMLALAHGQVNRPMPGGHSSFQSISFGSFPAYTDAESLNAMIQKIEDYSSHKGFMSIEWRSFGTPEACSLCSVLPEGKKRWEFIVDLEGSQEDLRKRLHGKKRNLIKKAEKSGLRVELAQSREQILSYRNLAMKTWQRKTDQGIRFPKPPREAQFKLMKKRLIDPGIGKMYLAYDGSDPVAGAFFAGFYDSAYYVLSAAIETGLKKSAPDLLIWTAMCDYQGEGVRRFNLGGVSENEVPDGSLEQSGLYHFKIRFSAQVKPCFNSSNILKPNRYRLWQLFNAAKPKLRSMLPWKH